MIAIQIILREELPGRIGIELDALSFKPCSVYEVEFAEELLPVIHEHANRIAKEHGDTMQDIVPMTMTARKPKGKT